jgi:tetratricopeptide (TPR) repeat protein
LLFAGALATSLEATAQVNCDAVFSKGLDHYYVKSYDSALRFFKKVISQCPSSVQKEQAAYNIAHIFTLKNLPDSSISHYRRLIKDCRYDSSFIARSTINVAILYTDQTKYDSAVYYYNLILASKFNDKDKSFAKKGILDEPYMNYHYYSCIYLGELYMLKKDYENAILNLNKASTSFPYQDYSATRQAAKSEALKSLTAYCTGLKGDIDGAYKILSSYMPLGKYSSQEYFVMILKAKHDSKEFITEVEKQVGQIKGKKEIILFNYKIDFSSLVAENVEEKNIKSEFLKTDLYKNYLNKY